MAHTRLYRIPVKVHGPRARTKGCVAYLQRWTGVCLGAPSYEILADPSAVLIDVRARTNREAMDVLQQTFLGTDPRPIKGRSMVKFFVNRIDYATPGTDPRD